MRGFAIQPKEIYVKIDNRSIMVEITGQRPGLLMSAFTDAVMAKIEKGSSGAVKARNQLTPRETAAFKVYMTDEPTPRPYIPGANILACIVRAGTLIKVGRTKLSTQKSSMIPAAVEIVEAHLPIFKPGEKTSAKFEVDTRGVVNPATGGRMVCHRPLFHHWQLRLELTYDAEMLDESTVRELFDVAGAKIGLGDFRPDRRGPFGRFLVTGWKTEKKS